MAATSISGTVRVVIDLVEINVDGSGDPITKFHRDDTTIQLGMGTGDYQVDRIWSDANKSISGATTLDMAGSSNLPDAAGASQTFAEVGLLYVRNLSGTSGQKISIGNGGANSVNGGPAFLPDDTSVINVPEGGILLLVCPKDANQIAITAGTADILGLDVSGGTQSAKMIIAGHSV